MIANVITKDKQSKPCRTDNYRRLAEYIADTKNDGEKTLFVWHDGCCCEDYYEAIDEALIVQDMNKRSLKDKTYHLLISFRPEDESKLDEKAFQDIERHFTECLGFSEYNRHCGVHINTGNLHMHIAYNMIHPEKFTRHEPYGDFYKLAQAAREMEAKYGLTVDVGVEEPTTEKSRPNTKAQLMEAVTGQETLSTYVKNRKDLILSATAGAKTWGDLHIALAIYGLKIKPRGNGMIIQTMDEKHQIKASELDRSFSKGKLEERLGEYKPANAVNRRQFQVKELYKAMSLHQSSPERENLYKNYQVVYENRKMEMNVINAEIERQLTVINEKYKELFEEIKYL